MRLPDLVSVVGVDESTNIDDIHEMDYKHLCDRRLSSPDIEWGVLYSMSRAGKDPRYPIRSFIEDLYSGDASLLRLSLHLCGSETIDAWIRGELDEMCSKFNRTQLNFNVAKVDEDGLLDRIASVNYRVIVQQNKTKAAFVQKLMDRGIEADILYDASGGFGRSITDKPIQPLIPNRFTGYAGGINPDNVLSVVESINRANPVGMSAGSALYYIDMESGVRTDNRFDLAKVAAVLNQLQHGIANADKEGS